MKVCDMCDKEFKPFNSVEMRCSKECKKIAQKIYDKKKRKTIIECATCGNDFVKSHGSAKTCSLSCGSALREKTKKDNYVAPKYKTKNELVIGINKFLLAMPN